MIPFVPVTRRLAASARRTPDAEALVHGPARTSFAGLWSGTAAVAAFLRASGLERGDRVALLLENSADYVAAYYGTMAAGGVAVGLNHAARAREISSWVSHCGARWLFADARHPDVAALLAGRRPGLGIVTRDGLRDTTTWPSAVPPAFEAEDVAPHDAAAIIYTSGTTGRPKGVVLTHGNLSANTAGIIEYLDLRPTDRVLNLLPFFYSYGASVLHTHLAAGGTIVLENSLVYPSRILARMSQERVTGFPGVPSTFSLLLQQTDLRRFDLGCLRYLTQAGGPMPPGQIARVRAMIPAADFFVMYGQTEATARLTYVPPAFLDAKPGSVGVPVRGVELRIEDEDGRSLPQGAAGDVCVRGENVMAGYYGDPEATAKVLRDGWLRTGDVGLLDADGFLFLRGRRSDIIKSGAHRISPGDIEEVIAALPAVGEVAVVGVADDVLGEAIKAVVAVRDGAAIDAMSIQRHCSQQLPRYKVPRIVEFTARLPRTASGKVMRYLLTEKKEDHELEARTV